MLQLRQASVKVNGQYHELRPDAYNSFPDFYVQFGKEDAPNRTAWSFFVHPKNPVVLQSIEYQFTFPKFSYLDIRILQTGITTANVGGWVQHDATKGWGKPWCAAPVKGIAKAWTELWIQAKSDLFHLYSTDEGTGFTTFEYDYTNELLLVKKDLGHRLTGQSSPDTSIELTHSFQALGIAIEQVTTVQTSTTPGQFIRLTALQQALPEEQLFSNTLFVLDKGWSKSVGDWRATDAKPADWVRNVQKSGNQAAVWLAPFLADPKSDLALKNPEWFLKDNKGQPIRTRLSASDSTNYLVLDPLHPGLKDYLSGIFHILVTHWKVDAVWISGLSATILQTPHTKTRGQMYQASLAWLKELCGTAKLYLDHAPLGNAGQLADMQLLSPEPCPDKALNRLTVLGRRLHTAVLNGKGAGYYSLKDQQKPVEQYTELILNALIFNHLCTHDQVENYSPEQQLELQTALSLLSARVTQITEVQELVFKIDLIHDNNQGTVWVNLSDKKQLVSITGQQWLEMMPFETLEFL